MTAGVLTAEVAAVVDAGPTGPEEPAQPYRWPVALLLHLGPGVLVMAGYLAMLPLARALDLPASLALTAAVALIGVPLELGFLLRARRRRPVGAVAFRHRLPPGRLAALTGSVLVAAAGLYLWLQPVSSALERDVFGWLPPAWFVGGEASVSRSALLAALLVSLVVDGLVSPVVQQLYFRGHLMPRLPVAAAPAGWLLAPVTSAALIAAQHLWQPQLVVFIFAVQVLLGVLVWRTRCLAVAILVQCAGNLFAIMTTLLLVLAR
jgi:membrane protease YdiL (CAAX protease family)